MDIVDEQQVAQHGKFFTFFVDDQEFHVEKSTMTGAEIMQMAGIPIDAGLILIEESGIQRQVAPDELIELQPGRRFKKAPRFKRG